MPLESKRAVRIFSFQGERLPDPNPEWNPEKVRDHYQKSGLSSLSNAAIKGPKHENGTLVYTFEQPIGSKG